ncbi:MAG: hypothetical protein JW751_03035 [Polyangiaceae bacterium]|nr:hypothetical protein [Polyangiaceae bacterium]
MPTNLDTLDPENAIRALRRQRTMKMVGAFAIVLLALSITAAVVTVAFSANPEAASEGELTP